LRDAARKRGGSAEALTPLFFYYSKHNREAEFVHTTGGASGRLRDGIDPVRGSDAGGERPKPKAGRRQDK